MWCRWCYHNTGHPRGTRSKSIENRAKGKGEWNKYTIICVDGTIKLAVNGKFVNGIRNSTVKKVTSASNLKDRRFISAILN
ncbi:family 16 glycoside hydrolase [Sphingobacterium sp. E70]|uniref:family 16 glycoside hydrolase n=1 Tax=Sphingobacterium sp. E70 TaxID=2853439 RepID=UPI00279543E4|nr:family 16 glycoside hydrolase [Sphingobacterium sp. E70]